jgi:hypothetical protein
MGELTEIDQKNINPADLVSYSFLTPESSQGIDSFVDIINGEWSRVFPLNKDILMKRFESGQIFIGAYINRKSTGILETIALEIEEPKFSEDATYKEKAALICGEIVKMGDYLDVTNYGKWKPFPKYSNVLLLVDITSDPLRRGLNNEISVASGIVDFGKFFMRQKPLERPKEMTYVEYVPTFTPNIPPLKKWHESLNAFDTKVISPKARKGYIKEKYPHSEDVNFMCYLAPGYLPDLGQKQLKKVA